MIRRTIVAVTIALLAGAGTFVTAEPSGASVYEGTVVFTCTTFTASGTGPHTLDRDNTGSNEERLRIDIFDGTGLELYTLTYENFLGTYSGGIIGTTPFLTEPTANPLRFVLTSLAGNGLDEQVDSDITGTCDEIPTVNCEVPDPVPDADPVATSSGVSGVGAAADAVCGELVVTKTVVGTAEPGTAFHVGVACEPPVETEEPEEEPEETALPSGTLAPFTTTLTFGQTGGTQTMHVTAGATCTVTETAQPPLCTLVSITPPSVVIEADATHTVTVTDSCELKPVEAVAVVLRPRFTG
jgi:hypothetical protein